MLRLLFLIITFLTIPFLAQGTHLRTPTATEYLDVILNTDTDEQDSLGEFLPLRFPHLYREDFETLKTAYNHLAINSGYADRRIWVQHLIHSWLREHQIDLSTEQHLVFEDFIIDVYPRDFNRDGVNEYLLDVYKSMPQDRAYCADGDGIVDYLLVQQDGDNYEFVEVPLPWLGGWRSPGIKELKFEDITADGIPEWTLIRGGSIGGGPGMGYVNMGELYILTWRNDALVEVTPPLDDIGQLRQTMHFGENTAAGGCFTAPFSVEWQFSNIDRDTPLEVLQSQTYLDNWYCEIEETRTFHWDGNLYVFRNRERVFSETRNCYQRFAVRAMWESNYKQAISLFEKGLALPTYSYDYDDDEYSQDYLNRALNQLDAYYRAQLALGYIMTEQPQKAKVVLENLQIIENEAVKQFVDSLVANIEHPVTACFDAYTVFTQVNLLSPHLGAIEELDSEETTYLPERIGCDAPALMEEILVSHPFTTDRTPVYQLEELGIKIADTLQVDLNNDEMDEWIVWTEAPITPLFFVQQGDHYLVSQVSIDQFRRSTGIQIRQLPDGTNALAYLNFHWLGDMPDWYDGYGRIGGIDGRGIGCPTPDNSYRGSSYVSLWRMQENHLVEFFNKVTCATDFQTLFPNGDHPDQIVVAREINDPKVEFGFAGAPDIYRWESTRKTFVPINPPTPMPVPTSTATPEFVSPYYRIIDALKAHDYSAALRILGAGEPEERVLFYRAFSFEMLNRPDEALAEYIAVHELAPESIWGRLAQLHLERNE